MLRALQRLYSNNRGTASPTQPQSVGGNYSPASALKPHILTCINYSSTVSHSIFTSPFLYHSSENITYNISHNPRFRSNITNTSAFVKSSGSTDSPAQTDFPAPAESCGQANQSAALILVRMSNVLLHL